MRVAAIVVEAPVTVTNYDSASLRSAHNYIDLSILLLFCLGESQSLELNFAVLHKQPDRKDLI